MTLLDQKVRRITYCTYDASPFWPRKGIEIFNILKTSILVNDDMIVDYQWALISKSVISVFSFKYSICPAIQCYNSYKEYFGIHCYLKNVYT